MNSSRLPSRLPLRYERLRDLAALLLVLAAAAVVWFTLPV